MVSTANFENIYIQNIKNRDSNFLLFCLMAFLDSGISSFIIMRSADKKFLHYLSSLSPKINKFISKAEEYHNKHVVLINFIVFIVCGLIGVLASNVAYYMYFSDLSGSDIPFVTIVFIVYFLFIFIVNYLINKIMRKVSEPVFQKFLSICYLMFCFTLCMLGFLKFFFNILYSLSSSDSRILYNMKRGVVFFDFDYNSMRSINLCFVFSVDFKKGTISIVNKKSKIIKSTDKVNTKIYSIYDSDTNNYTNEQYKYLIVVDFSLRRSKLSDSMICDSFRCRGILNGIEYNLQQSNVKLNTKSKIIKNFINSFNEVFYILQKEFYTLEE